MPYFNVHLDKCDLLNECSNALRKAGKVAMAFRLDELRDELEEMTCR